MCMCVHDNSVCCVTEIIRMCLCSCVREGDMLFYTQYMYREQYIYLTTARCHTVY